MRVKTDYIDYDKVDEKTRASMDRLFSAPRRGYWARKRAFDIIVSLIMLLLLVPLFIVVSIVIVIDDPHAGPFFKQQRVGRHGVEFSMYKFRTMVANAEQLKDIDTIVLDDFNLLSLGTDTTEYHHVYAITVPEGCVFVMGDNRNDSDDSRDPELGPVDTRQILGRAVFLLFPGVTADTDKRDFGRIGPLT